MSSPYVQLRPFEADYEVPPGVVVRRTGGQTPGHSVVRLASGSDRLTLAGCSSHPSIPSPTARKSTGKLWPVVTNSPSRAHMWNFSGKLAPALAKSPITS
jgi:hypothetical protein